MAENHSQSSNDIQYLIDSNSFMSIKNPFQVFLATIALINLFATPSRANPEITNQTISIEELKDAQQGWCNALIKISNTHENEGLEKAKSIADQIIDTAYGYNLGPVAFKPTWATGKTTFRTTRDGALSYFIGDDTKYNDKGFAIGSPEASRSPWTSCTIENSVVQLYGNTANSIGWVHFTAESGYKSTVDKTWTFIKDNEGNLRIVLHHSSAPYSGY